MIMVYATSANKHVPTCHVSCETGSPFIFVLHVWAKLPSRQLFSILPCSRSINSSEFSLIDKIKDCESKRFFVERARHEEILRRMVVLHTLVMFTILVFVFGVTHEQRLHRFFVPFWVSELASLLHQLHVFILQTLHNTSTQI